MTTEIEALKESLTAAEAASSALNVARGVCTGYDAEAAEIRRNRAALLSDRTTDALILGGRVAALDQALSIIQSRREAAEPESVRAEAIYSQSLRNLAYEISRAASAKMEIVIADRLTQIQALTTSFGIPWGEGDAAGRLPYTLAFNTLTRGNDPILSRLRMLIAEGERRKAPGDSTVAEGGQTRALALELMSAIGE